MSSRQQQQQDPCEQLACTPRLTFWICAGTSWVVWVFAVAAGADNKWLRNEDGEEFLAAGGDGLLDFCDELDDDSVYKDFCAMFRAFTAMQVIATIACSFSVLLLSVAFFRPSVGGCFSARRLAFIGGALMTTYAVFQLIAVVLGGTMKQEIDSAADEATFGDSEEGELGPAFGVAVTAVILATLFAVLLLLFARHTGNGPLYECCHSLMLANKANDSPATGDGVGREKPMPTATATTPAAPHHYEDAGAVPLPTATGTAAGEQQQQQQQQQNMAPPPYNELPPAAEI